MILNIRWVFVENGISREIPSCISDAEFVELPERLKYVVPIF